MASCPKCNYKLKASDWRQNCPKCGANLILSDLHNRLMDDADIAEVQYYHFQKKIDRLKAAFVGTKYAIIRIFTSLLPILGLLFPMVKIKTSAPFPDYDGNLDAIFLIKAFDSGGLSVDSILGIFSAPETKAVGLSLILAAAGLVLFIVAILIHFVFLMLACSPKGRQRNYTLDGLMVLFYSVTLIAFVFIPDNSIINASLSYGAIITIVLIILCIILDVLAFKNQKEIKHKQCYVGGIPIEEYFEMLNSGMPKDEIRAEMYKRLSVIQEENLKRILEEENKPHGGRHGGGAKGDKNSTEENQAENTQTQEVEMQ